MLLGCPLTIARSEIRQYLGTSAISAGETCFGNAKTDVADGFAAEALFKFSQDFGL